MLQRCVDETHEYGRYHNDPLPIKHNVCGIVHNTLLALHIRVTRRRSDVTIWHACVEAIPNHFNGVGIEWPRLQ
jgi:hypothetical protein